MAIIPGAFLNSGEMGYADIAHAIPGWESWTGRPLRVVRDYSNGLSDFTFHPRYTQATANGQKLCLDLLPAWNPVSSADLASLESLLSSMKAAGINAEISLWHEPFFSGITDPAQFIAMWRYYARAVRSYYPLVFCTSLSAIVHNNENSYYPGAIWVDKVVTDYYAVNYENGFLLDAAAAIADNANPPKPFGIWEFNALVNGGNFLTQPQSGFENGGTGSAGTWTNVTNDAIAATTAQAHTGSASLALTSVAAGTMSAGHCLAANFATQMLACVPGDVISVQAWFQAATAGRTCQAGAQFYTSAGTLLSTSFGGVTVTDTTTGWTKADTTTGTGITTPASAAWCRAFVQVQSTAAAGEVHYVDDVSISNLSQGYSQTQVGDFFGYIQSYFATRAAAGKQNADVLLFNGAGANSTEIQSPSDFRLPLLQAMWRVPAPVPVIVSPPNASWHFLYGPALSLPDGEIGQAATRTLTMRAGAGNYSEAGLVINGRTLTAAAITELQTDLHVIYGGKLLFTGRVVPTQDDLAADTHTETITALDYREVLRRRAVYAPVSWTTVDQATIAWQLITAAQALPGGNLGITQGNLQTGVPRTYTAAAGDMTGADIDTLAQMDNGFDWDITPYGPADLRLDVWYPSRGVNRGVILELGGSLVSTISRSVDPSTYANAVYLTGDSSVSLTPQALAAADIATRPEGRWDTAVGTSLLTQSSLNARAAWYLADAQVVVPTYSIVLHPGAWQGPGHIWLGDILTVRIKSGRLNVNDQLAVSELDFSVNADGMETVTLTVGRVPFRLYQALPKMLRRLRDLELR